jgi:DNA-binding CsgD family transcriptional regulator
MKNDLSPRELSVLTLASRGYTDDMIAAELGIERGTVNSYWIRIRGKHGHLSRTELVARLVHKEATELALEKLKLTDHAATDQKRLLDAANAEIARLSGLLQLQSERDDPFQARGPRDIA